MTLTWIKVLLPYFVFLCFWTLEISSNKKNQSVNYFLTEAFKVLLLQQCTVSLQQQLTSPNMIDPVHSQSKMHMQAGKRENDKVPRLYALDPFLIHFSLLFTLTPPPCVTQHPFSLNSFNVTLHLWLANSGLISCHLHMEISVSHFFYILWDSACLVSWETGDC